ncbi:MAG: DNA glycosylase [Eubacteriales bacterium]|nr:DNA glycosylase [Eubacteriales bacterium]
MRLSIPGFDLAFTAESGQCFRMGRVGDNRWRVIAFGRALEISSFGDDIFEFHCSQEDFDTLWRGYFDLGTDYHSICSLVHPGDGYLYEAVCFAGGLRILIQEPFETLISFIISQRKSVGAIRYSVEKLCQAYGEEIDPGIHAFPAPEALAGASLEGLLACSLGYRAKYILETSRMVHAGKPALNGLHALDDKGLLAALLPLPGVGIIVANCVLLFAFHRLDAFPVDVWIERVLASQFPEGFPFERFPGVSGVLQQHLFCYARASGRHKLVK